MTKKTRHLKADIVLKNYWRDNERFADLFNAVLYGGEQVIGPEELEDADTEESYVLEHGNHAESIQAARDNIKVRKRSSVHGVEYVLLGNEAQEHVHYAMPMRVMGYDYGTYKNQYDRNAESYKTTEGMDRDEFLSKMRRTDKLMPVITLVVYYGEKPWDGATTLHGMLDIPTETARYVNDYKILLVEARRNDLTFHHADNLDLFNLLEIILDRSISGREAREKAVRYGAEHNTGKSVIMTVAGVTNSGLDYADLEKGEKGMCSLFEELAKDAEAKGIVEMGVDFGLSVDAISYRLQNKLGVSSQQAQEYLEEFGVEATI